MTQSIFGRLNQLYQENIGQPFVRSTPGQALSGFLGVESQGTAPDAYKLGQGASMVPGLGAPAGIFKAAAQLPNLVDAGQAGLGLIFGSKALKNGVTAKDAITAEQLLKNGATPNQIFQQGQGLFKGPDGNWRRMTSDIQFEQPFVNLIENMKAEGPLVGDYALDAIYTNKALFDAYPDLKKVKVTFDPTMKDHQHGSFNPSTGILRLNPNKDPKTMHETMVHELQHSIQTKEGWQKGGNTFSMLPENAQRAVGHADTAIAKINDRIGDLVKETGIPRSDISAAARFFAAKRMNAKPTKEEIDAANRLVNAPESVKRLFRDAETYGDVQAKLAPFRDDAFRHYQKLQGEAEAREVERQLKAARAGQSLTNPVGKYDDLRFDDLIKRGDTTSFGINVDWKENPLLRNSLLGIE